MRIFMLAALCLSLTSAIYAQNEVTQEQEKFAVKVDLNSADERQLAQLPGVGEVNAEKIIAGRPYTTVEDLAGVGVPALVIQKISPLVTVAADSTPLNTDYTPEKQDTVDLNHATFFQLESLPGISPAQAREIVASRPFAAVSDLSRAGLTSEEIQALAPDVFVVRRASTTDLQTGIQCIR